jgi:uncharacterized iron-regulated membrane protein
LGTLAWWRRRPAGELAAPPGTPGFAPGTAATAAAVALGLFFPLAGATMIIALAIDTLVSRARRAAA